MASVQIGCPCPGRPHDSDSVQLRDVLDFRHAAAIKYAVRIFKMDHPDSDAGETLQFLSEQYLRHGIEAWTLRDESQKLAKDRLIPVTWPNIEQYLFANPAIASEVAEKADDLYVEAVMLPLVMQAATSSQPGPTNGSTSAPTGSSQPKGRTKRSRRSSTSTTPMADTEPMSALPAGGSRS